MKGLEEIDLVGTKENLLDHMWLFNNIPWSNHGGKIAKISFNEPIDLYSIVVDEYLTQSAKITKYIFDNVSISALHGFAGNSYNFTFRLGEQNVLHLWDRKTFDYDIDNLKKNYINYLETDIERLYRHIEYKKKIIENINIIL